MLAGTKCAHSQETSVCLRREERTRLKLTRKKCSLAEVMAKLGCSAKPGASFFIGVMPAECRQQRCSNHPWPEEPRGVDRSLCWRTEILSCCSSRDRVCGEARCLGRLIHFTLYHHHPACGSPEVESRDGEFRHRLSASPSGPFRDANFEETVWRPVLGCIETDICTQILVFQHFPKFYKIISTSQIFFRTSAPLSCTQGPVRA